MGEHGTVATPTHRLAGRFTLHILVRRRDYDREVLGEASARPNVRLVAQDIVAALRRLGGADGASRVRPAGRHADFDTDQHDGAAFFYVLPDAPDRALVEHTLFSLHPRRRGCHDEHIRALLDRLGAGDVTVTGPSTA